MYECIGPLSLSSPSASASRMTVFGSPCPVARTKRICPAVSSRLSDRGVNIQSDCWRNGRRPFDTVTDSWTVAWPGMLVVNLIAESCFRSVTSVRANIACAQVCLQVAAFRGGWQQAHLNRVMGDVVVHDRLVCLRAEHLPCDSRQSHKRRHVTAIFSK